MDTIGPNISRSLLFWLVLVLPLLVDEAAGASVREVKNKQKKLVLQVEIQCWSVFTNLPY